MTQKNLSIAIIALIGILLIQPVSASDANPSNVSTKTLEYMSKAALFEYCDKAASNHVTCKKVVAKLDVLKGQIFFYNKGTPLQQVLVLYSDQGLDFDASVYFSFNKDGYMEVLSRGFMASYAVEETVSHFRQFGYDE